MVIGDRNKQWEKYEALLRKHGNTRKEIQKHRDIFFEGSYKPGTHWSLLFYLWPDPTLEGLQKLLDEVITDPLTDADFEMLQGDFCGVLSDYFCPIETQDYYFKATFGEVYDPDRVFPLRINREKEHRRLTYTPNNIFQALAFYFNKYMHFNQPSSGVLRFNTGYLESLLPHVDPCFFSVAEIEGRELEQLFASRLRAVVISLLKWPVEARRQNFSEEQIANADKVKASLMKNADQLGELRALEAKVMAEMESQE